MRKFSFDVSKPIFNKIRIAALTSLSLFIIFSILFIGHRRNVLAIIGGLMWFLIIIDLVVIFLLTRKYYNWSLAFLLLILLAIVFRSQRWPLTGALYTISFTGLACISIYSATLFYERYVHNSFLRYIGFSSNIILSIVSIGLLFKTMHWPLAGLFLNSGLVMFIPFLFAFIFTLPSSDYLNWKNSDRVIFFRTIIFPMVFVYALCVLMFVFPDLWNNLTRTPITPFNMYEFNLLEKPGLY